MTTRRRRAGSDTLEESAESSAPSQINIFTPPSQNKSSDLAAFYKKTDLQPQTASRNFHSPQQNFFVPPQPYCGQNQAPAPSVWNLLSQELNNYCSEQPNPPNQSQPDLLEFPEIREESGLISEMASRDRTAEFAGILRSQQNSHIGNGISSGTVSRSQKDFSHYSAFMKRSRFIGRNISSTYAKLEKLTHLAKKRSLFDDSGDAEVSELTGIIRHDLASLTKQLNDLRPSPDPQMATNHMQKHSANLVGSLQTKVANITQKFKNVLEVRTENLKRQAERRDQFAGAPQPFPPSGAVGAVPKVKSAPVLLADEAKAIQAHRRTPSGHVALDLEGAGPLLGGDGAYQTQLELMEEQDSVLQARADTMKTIESTIVELGAMFMHLATMVKEQDELVHRIDSNVDEAEMNVEAAHSELLKYFKSISSNRWLMIKIFGILAFFMVFFIVFMA